MIHKQYDHSHSVPLFTSSTYCLLLVWLKANQIQKSEKICLLKLSSRSPFIVTGTDTISSNLDFYLLVSTQTSTKVNLITVICICICITRHLFIKKLYFNVYIYVCYSLQTLKFHLTYLKEMFIFIDRR